MQNSEISPYRTLLAEYTFHLALTFVKIEIAKQKFVAFYHVLPDKLLNKVYIVKSLILQTELRDIILAITLLPSDGNCTFGRLKLC